MKNIAIIPARSGSKGLPNKNIKCINGKPLMYYSIQAAKNACMFDEVMVSTDSEQYAEIAIQCGASVPFIRTCANSGDSSSSWDVVSEVLYNYMRIGKFYDTICLLQPTSPLRTSKDIVDAYRFFCNKNADAVTSVCACEHSPQWCMTLDDDQSLYNFRRNILDLPRQNLSQFYRLNGAIYIRTVTYSEEITINTNNEYAFIMSSINSIDIDTIYDFEFASFILDKMK